MRRIDAVELLWDADQGLEASSELYAALGRIKPKTTVTERMNIIRAIRALLVAQHNVSYAAGVAEQLTASPERKP